MSSLEDELPAWSMRRDDPRARVLSPGLPAGIDRDWAWGGSGGENVQVAVIDSGVNGQHDLVGGVARAAHIERTQDGETRVIEGSVGDRAGRRQSRGRGSIRVLLHPDPPVEFFGRGMNVEVAWLGASRIIAAGNSFATTHLTGNSFKRQLARHQAPENSARFIGNIRLRCQTNRESEACERPSHRCIGCDCLGG